MRVCMMHTAETCIRKCKKGVSSLRDDSVSDYHLWAICVNVNLTYWASCFAGLCSALELPRGVPDVAMNKFV